MSILTMSEPGKFSRGAIELPVNYYTWHAAEQIHLALVLTSKASPTHLQGIRINSKQMRVSVLSVLSNASSCSHLALECLEEKYKNGKLPPVSCHQIVDWFGKCECALCGYLPHVESKR